MDLPGTDTDLCPNAELHAVSELGASVDADGVYLVIKSRQLELLLLILWGLLSWRLKNGPCQFWLS
ncbi:MAG: hypothetical protein JW712_06610 [Dehalococcoidales bacterium]|nr:hypothetical protein [Dehalococcoidales bacterium]